MSWIPIWYIFIKVKKGHEIEIDAIYFGEAHKLGITKDHEKGEYRTRTLDQRVPSRLRDATL